MPSLVPCPRWTGSPKRSSISAPGISLMAIATDGTGATQEGTETPPLPSGVTGWHRIEVFATAWMEVALGAIGAGRVAARGEKAFAR